MAKLVLFDFNGTLVGTKSGKTFPVTPDDWEILPGRVEKCKALLRGGLRLGIVTNQGGAAFGYFDLYVMRRQIIIAAANLGIDGRAVMICFHHPDGTVPDLAHPCPARKPGADGLLAAMDFYGIGPKQTLMVGDRAEDEEAAKAAGCSFCPSDEYFRLSMVADPGYTDASRR